MQMSVFWLSKDQEAQEKKLDLSAHKEGDIDRLITYMYTLRYGHDDFATSFEQVQTDVAMHTLDDLFDIQSLRLLALESVRLKIAKWTTAMLSNNGDALAKTLNIAYDHAASEIGRLLVERLAGLGLYSGQIQLPQLLDLVHSFPEYGVDVIKRIASHVQCQPPGVKGSHEFHYRCPNCLVTFKTSMIPYGGLPLGSIPRYNCFGCNKGMTAAEWRKNLVERTV